MATSDRDGTGPARSSDGASAFSPYPLFRNPHVQALLASTSLRLLPLRIDGGLTVVEAEQPMLLDGGDGACLRALHSDGTPFFSPGLVVLLHGWHGSATSTGVLVAAELLYRAGYDVVRLELRDHGDTHHLNEGLFHANRLDEVVGALRDLARRLPDRRLALVGFSLGGNFALRVALRAPAAGLNLSRVVAVNPALNPSRTLEAIDARPLYRHYFLRAWRQSLLRKQDAFPGLYDFRDALRLRTVRALTEYVLRHTPYSGLEDYFAGYSLTGSRLAALAISTTIVTSADDPIIDVEDFQKLPRTPMLEIEIHDRGGHCGYIEGPAMRPWLEELILSVLSRPEPDGSTPARAPMKSRAYHDGTRVTR